MEKVYDRLGSIEATLAGIADNQRALEHRIVDDEDGPVKRIGRHGLRIGSLERSRAKGRGATGALFALLALIGVTGFWDKITLLWK